MLLSLATGVCLLGLWIIVAHINRLPALERCVGALRDDGFPVTRQEYFASVDEVSDSENAAPLLLQGFVPITQLSDDVLRLAQIDKSAVSLSDEDLAAAREMVAELETLTKNIHHALSRPVCRFPIPLDFNWSTPLPHLAHSRTAGGLLALSAVVHADSGAGGDAATAIELCLRLAEYLGDDLLVASLVRGSIQMAACRAIEQILCRGG